MSSKKFIPIVLLLVFLMLPLANAGVITGVFLSQPDYNRNLEATGKDGTDTSIWGQTFTLNNTYTQYNLTTIKIDVYPQANPTCNLTVSLYASDGSVPTGGILASSIPFNVTGFGGGSKNFTFASSYSLLPDTWYAFAVALTGGTVDETNHLHIGAKSAISLSGNDFKWNGVGWTALTYDFTFALYGEVFLASSPQCSSLSTTSEYFEGVTYLDIPLSMNSKWSVVDGTLSHYIIEINTVAGYVNSTATAFTSEWVNYTYTATVSPIYWRCYANSSMGKWNVSSWQTVVLTSIVLPQVNTDSYWTFLYAGDFAGFFMNYITTVFTSLSLGVACIMILLFVPIYIRTKSLLVPCVLWILIGSFLTALFPAVVGVSVLFLCLGIAGLFYKLFRGRDS